MPTLLQIDSSPRSASVSGQLAARYVAQWKQQNPGAAVIRHNTSLEKLPYVDEAMLNAMFTPEEARGQEQLQSLALSDKLVEELLAADVLVLAVPMWNLGIPASLKAWVDLISRAGKTFRYTATGVESLVPAGKKVVVFTARGGSYPAGTMAQAFDQQEPYLRAVFGFLGLTDVTFIHAENQSRSGDAPAQAIAKAEAELAELLVA